MRTLKVMAALTAGCLGLFVMSCSGSSGSPDGNSPGQPLPTTVIFPPQRSRTDARRITVRGTSDAGRTKQVTVNDVAASSADAFATWQAAVPLLPGTNTLRVVARDKQGAEVAQPIEVSVQAGALLRNPIDIAPVGEDDRALVIDRDASALLAVDLVSGTSSVISGDGVGVGEDLLLPGHLAIDSLRKRALVVSSFSRELEQLLAIDLTSGDRNRATGTGPFPVVETVLAADASRDRVLLAGTSLSGRGTPLWSIDLGSGENSVISSDEVGSGPALAAPSGMALETGGDRVLVANSIPAALLEVDLTTGNRRSISDLAIGSGPFLGRPTALALDRDRLSAVVGTMRDETGEGAALLMVDLASGDRAVLSDSTRGSGAELKAPKGLALDPDRDRILVADPEQHAILAVDLATGDRSRLADGSAGSGPGFSLPGAVAYDAEGSRLLVADQEQRSVLSVDVRTGERIVVASDSIGSGPSFESPAAIALEAQRGRVVVVDATAPAILAIDLLTGNRTQISSNLVGGGPGLQAPASIAMDEGHDRALVVDGELAAVLAIDLVSGARSLISGNSAGSGPAFQEPRGIAVDTDHNRAFVVDQSARVLFVVDLGNGARAKIADLLHVEGVDSTEPSAIALDLARNQAVVVGRSQEWAIQVDLTTGAAAVRSGPTSPGPRLTSPTHIALDSRSSLAWVTDSSLAGILQIDLVSEERVLISR